MTKRIYTSASTLPDGKRVYARFAERDSWTFVEGEPRVVAFETPNTLYFGVDISGAAPPYVIPIPPVAPATDWGYTGLTEAKAKILALTAQVQHIRTEVVVADDITRCIGLDRDLWKAHLDKMAGEAALADGQPSAVREFEHLYIRWADMDRCVRRLERETSIAEAMLDHFYDIGRTAADLQFIAKHRAEPLSKYTIEKGRDIARAKAFADPANASLLVGKTTLADKLAALIKVDAKRKALEIAEVDEENKLEGVWLGKLGYIEHPRFKSVSKFDDHATEWDMSFLDAVPDGLTAKG